MRLDRLSSADIVNEISRVLGLDRAIEVLDVETSRFKALANERGCLTDSQLKRISEETGRPWTRWGVDGGARHAKTAEARAFVARARRMLDEMDGDSGSRPVRKTKSSAALRKAV